MVILLDHELIFVRWGFVFPIFLVPRYKLYLCHTRIKPDLLCFSRIGVFSCGLRDHEVRIIRYQILAPLIRLYPFISCIFLFILCALCFGFDLVSDQFRSYCLLPTLFLISCVELSLLGLKNKGVILFFLSKISF
jgi:hypothetical protein